MKTYLLDGVDTLPVFIFSQYESKRTSAGCLSVVLGNALLLTLVIQVTSPFHRTLVFVISLGTVFHAVADVFTVDAVSECGTDKLLLVFAHVLIHFAVHLAIHFVFAIRTVADSVTEPGFLLEH